MPSVVFDVGVLPEPVSSATARGSATDTAQLSRMKMSRVRVENPFIASSTPSWQSSVFQNHLQESGDVSIELTIKTLEKVSKTIATNQRR